MFIVRGGPKKIAY